MSDSTDTPAERFSTQDQIGERYDESSLGQREALLKPHLSGAALEKWFGDLNEREQSVVFNQLLGVKIPTS